MARNILRLPQISERTGVPVATLRYWRQAGEGPPTFRLGKHVASFEDDVDAWLEEQATSSAKGTVRAASAS